MSNKIRIGGVPEHFNLPIHLAIENGEFEQRGVELEWHDCPGGTGQMTKAMREGELDLCVLLTEGIISDIVKGNPSRIISLYVKTALTWGVHTGANNRLAHYDQIFNKKYAISRFGSGSHLMAIVDANSKGKTLDNDQFEVIKNLDGAIESLGKNESDVFYWEKYTTKPYVDKGLFKRIGEYVTPWPCFVIAGRNEILDKQPENVTRVLRIIHDSCDAFMRNPDAIKLVSDRYGQQMADVERWYHSTEWAIHGWVSDKIIESIIFHLRIAGIIDQYANIPELVWIRK